MSQFRMSPKRSAGFVIALTIFTLLFSALAGVFAWVSVGNLLTEWETGAWAEAAGVIVTSEGSPDSVYVKADIRYRFEVDGAAHEGAAVRWSEPQPIDRKASEALETYPVGSEVTVRYDPADPTRNALEAGMTGGDAFFAFFITPFVVLSLLLWRFIASAVRCRLAPPPFEDGKVIEQHGRTFARISPPRALTWAGVAALALSWLGAMGCAFGYAMAPPMGVVTVTACIVAGVSVLAGLIAFIKARSGRHDLVLDATDGTLIRPGADRREASALIALESITAIEAGYSMEEKSALDFKRFAVTAVYEDGSGESQRTELACFMFMSKAESLADWLRERLGVAGGDA